MPFPLSAMDNLPVMFRIVPVGILTGCCLRRDCTSSAELLSILRATSFYGLPKQMFSGNVRVPSVGICGESEEINLIVVCFNLAIVSEKPFRPTFAVS